EWHDTLLVPAASSPCEAQAATQRTRGDQLGYHPRPPSTTVGPPDPTVTCPGPPSDINLATPGSITFRVYFNPVTVGCFVAHCHIIDYEDVGMMQRFDILPAPGGSSDCMLDVAVRPSFQKQLAALKNSFELCTSSAPRFTSWKQFPRVGEWRAPDLR